MNSVSGEMPNGTSPAAASPATGAAAKPPQHPVVVVAGELRAEGEEAAGTEEVASEQGDQSRGEGRRAQRDMRFEGGPRCGTSEWGSAERFRKTRHLEAAPDTHRGKR